MGFLIQKTHSYIPENHIKKHTHTSMVEVRITEKLKSTDYYSKYIAEVQNVENQQFWKPIKGKIIVQIPKERKISLQENQAYFIIGRTKITERPKNPYTFNYANYLKYKKVFVQIKADSILPTNKEKISESIFSFKEYCIHKIDQSKLSPQAKETLKALTLADRSEITNETVKLLSLAGIIHLFAISGLHIVFIFSFFYWVFKTILGAKRQKIIVLLSLLGILLYGYFINFPVSVVRAILMLCIYYGFMLLKRNPMHFHSLFLTGIIMLVYNPFQLFEVGFQLSFSAVFFIFWLQKPIKNVLPKYTFYKTINPIISITVSAQLGTLPLCLYYFHQYSVLSVFLNVLIVPFAGIIVALSFLVLIILVLFSNIEIIISLYNYVIQLLFLLAEWTTQWKYLNFQNIPFSLQEMMALYVVIFTLGYVLLKQKSWKPRFVFLVSLFLFESIRMGTNSSLKNQEEMIVFHEYKNTIVGIKKGNNFLLYSEDSLSKNFQNYSLNACLLHYRKPNLFVENQPFKSLSFNRRKVHIISDSSIPKTTKNDWVVIQNLPKIEVEKLRNLPVKKIIIDGSNYPSYAQELKEELGEKAWITSEQGAYIETF